MTLLSTVHVILAVIAFLLAARCRMKATGVEVLNDLRQIGIMIAFISAMLFLGRQYPSVVPHWWSPDAKASAVQPDSQRVSSEARRQQSIQGSSSP
jgi:hypothetical protein